LSTSQSIGIFDSGIGGLTVANAISRLLPLEHLVYFGDTEHMPYGEKSADLIQEFSTKITKFLIEEKKCKAIVIACNTASAMAYSQLKETYLGHVPIINVIDPMVELLIDRAYSIFGIIATRGTVESNTYQDKICRRIPNQNYSILATPLLATMIEEGFINDEVSQSILNSYLNFDGFKDIDALVLACTHYPLIADMISNFFNHKVEIIKSGDIVAEKLNYILNKEGLQATQPKLVLDEFIVSDLTKNFENSAKNFYGKQIILKEVKL
jgi:glutamate racemase